MMRLPLRAFGLVMTLIVTLTAAAMVASGPARADAGSAAEVQGVISGQIEAFRQDDGAKAYAFASPNIQALFPSVDGFMAMVRGHYAPVYHPRQFQFGALTDGDGKLMQTVELTAADGTAWTAEYTLGRQPDGSLKIEACRLTQQPGIGA